MNQSNNEIALVLYCLVLPILLLLPKVGNKIKNYFNGSSIYLITGLIIFSIFPIYYDYYYNHLGWNILIRIIYVVLLFLSLYINKINNIKYSHFLIYLLLFLPLYFDILPGGVITLPGDISIKTNVVGTIPLCFYLYIVVHPIDEDISYDFGTTINFKFIHFAYSVAAVIFLSLTVVPFAAFLDFVKLKEEVGTFPNFIAQLFIFMLAVGFPEEMFFRVIFLYILKKYNPSISGLKYIIISSLFFGVAHIFSPTPGHPAPNWIYAILAGMFGVMYSYIYIKTNQLFHAALVHSFVDSLWIHWFMLS
jgi:membrane protease YdiL (CAAX protease family)